jgi:hypothetical protein
MGWDNELSLSELRAWQQHPDTVARMNEVIEWNNQERLRKWHEAEREQERITAERAAQERREQEERDRKWKAERDAERERRALEQRRKDAVRQREARAKHYGLTLRNVRFEQRGDHAIWSTGHRTKRMVHGLASTSTINTHKYSLDASKCRIDFPIPLLVSHEKFGSVGEIVLARRSPREVYVIAALHDDNPASDYAWELVRQGELRAFSGAAEKDSATIAGCVLDVKFYSDWVLGEVSLCRPGANPDCVAEIFSHPRKVL